MPPDQVKNLEWNKNGKGQYARIGSSFFLVLTHDKLYSMMNGVDEYIPVIIFKPKRGSSPGVVLYVEPGRRDEAREVKSHLVSAFDKAYLSFYESLSGLIDEKLLEIPWKVEGLDKLKTSSEVTTWAKNPGQKKESEGIEIIGRTALLELD